MTRTCFYTAMKKLFIGGIVLSTIVGTATARAETVVSEIPAKIIVNFPFAPSQEMCAAVTKNVCSVTIFNLKKPSPGQNYTLAYKVLIGVSNASDHKNSWNVHADVSRYKLFPSGSVASDGVFSSNAVVSSDEPSTSTISLGDNLNAEVVITPNSGTSLASDGEQKIKMHRVDELIRSVFPLWGQMPS